jgi:2-dehydrotetronate isomerase
MPIRFAANLGFLWPQLPLLERIDAASRAGFSACEFHWPYDVPAQDLGDRCRQHDVSILGINTPRGDVAKREFGLAAVPGREAAFREQFEATLQYALTCGARAIHVLAGVSEPTPAARATLIANLRWAADKASPYFVTLFLEALNPIDNPGYFYASTTEVVSVLKEVEHAAIKLQFDAYHVARVEGDVMRTWRSCHRHIGHVQIAGVPTRSEPDQSEFDYGKLFAELRLTKYSGFVGCEYKPRGDTDAGLGWMKTLGLR